MLPTIKSIEIWMEIKVGFLYGDMGGSVCSLHLFLEERLILFHFKGCIYMPIHVYIIYMCMHIFKKFKY